jgi:hypothetical protein
MFNDTGFFKFQWPSLLWIWSALWSDAKIQTISICYNRHFHCSWKFQLNTTTQCKKNPSEQASKDMYSRFTAVKKKRRHCKMSYVLLQLHCFLASLSFQFILKCTTDCIFIEFKLTRVCDWLIHPSTTLLCAPIYCRLLALSCVIQSTAAFLRFLVRSNLLPPSCACLCDPIYCRLLALSCVIQSTAAFLCFLVWSNLLPPSCVSYVRFETNIWNWHKKFYLKGKNTHTQTHTTKYM